MQKVKCAVLFGGRSVEHEISVISGLQLILAIDQTKYEVNPVYIAPSGKWYTGDKLLERKFYKNVPAALTELEEVVLLPIPKIGGLVRNDSRMTSRNIIPIDVFIPAFHGQYGEDGCIQGLFEMADVAYTGSNVLASAVSMNKYLCKKSVASVGVPILPAVLATRTEAQRNMRALHEKILSNKEIGPLPLFVKPNNLGSSIGVSRVSIEKELDNALAKVFKYDEQALIEPCITNLMEINVSIRRHKASIASVVEIPVSSTGVLSYEDKYLREGKGKKTGESQGMASLTRVIDPQDLDHGIRDRVIEYGKVIFDFLDCSGVARLDFIVDTAKNELYFNEINPFPGSASFYLWIKSHPQVLYTQLIEDMINDALERKMLKDSLDRNIGLKALK